MVKLTGPMSSFKASGTLAGLLTYSNSRGRPYMKKKSHTPDQRTNPQLTYRMMFIWLANHWPTIGPAARLLWEAPAQLAKISPYNAYIGANTKRWLNMEGPSQTPTVDDESSISIRQIGWGYYANGTFYITLKEAASANRWGHVLHAGPIGGYTPTRATAVQINLDGPVGYQYLEYSPLNPVSTKFRLTTFNVDGRMAILSRTWTAII